MVAVSVVLVPAALLGWWLLDRPAFPPAVWAIGVVSGVLEAAYYVTLTAAYRRGDLSVVYPLARGTALVLAVVVGVVILQEHLAPLALAGVALLVVGLLVVQRPWRLLGRGGDDRAAVALRRAAVAGQRRDARRDRRDPDPRCALGPRRAAGARRHPHGDHRRL